MKAGKFPRRVRAWRLHAGVRMGGWGPRMVQLPEQDSRSRAIGTIAGAGAALVLLVQSAAQSAAQSAGMAQPLPNTPNQPARQPRTITGVWYDDTAQGAVELRSCGDRLCGRIVWLKAPLAPTGKPLVDGNNPDAKRQRRPICGLDVIGNLARQSDGSWDGGWIYDPKTGKSYDVEVRLRDAQTLQVTGYAGFKFLSETLIWRRAPADLRHCD